MQVGGQPVSVVDGLRAIVPDSSLLVRKCLPGFGVSVFPFEPNDGDGDVELLLGFIDQADVDVEQPSDRLGGPLPLIAGWNLPARVIQPVRIRLPGWLAPARVFRKFESRFGEQRNETHCPRRRLKAALSQPDDSSALSLFLHRMGLNSPTKREVNADI